MKKTPNYITEKATEMATYFEDNIAIVNLTEWIAISNSSLSAFPVLNTLPGRESDASVFVNSIGRFILADLIQCKTKMQRIDLLKTDLITIFDSSDYQGCKQVVFDINEAFMKSFLMYIDNSSNTKRFLSIHLNLIYLVEMYRDYCSLRNEELKAERA